MITEIQKADQALIERLREWRKSWPETSVHEHVRELEAILASDSEHGSVVAAVMDWRRRTFSAYEMHPVIQRLDLILEAHSYEPLLEAARKIAAKGVARDDGYTYSVPAADLVGYRDAILWLATAVDELRTRDLN
jgi:hypothetical protein